MTKIDDDCGNDCHETDCPDRVLCEGCNKRPHRDQAVACEDRSDSWYLCWNCHEGEETRVQIRREQAEEIDRYRRVGS